MFLSQTAYTVNKLTLIIPTQCQRNYSANNYN